MADQNPSSNGSECSDEQKQADVDSMLATITQIKDDGNSFFKKKEYHHAVEKYDVGIDTYKTFVRGDYDKSNTDALKKLKIVMGSMYNNRAFAYFRLEMFGQTVLDATNAIKFNFFKAYYRRGCANIALSKVGKAKKDFEKALEKFPSNKDIKSKLKLATTAWQQQKFFAAIATEAGKPVSQSIKLEDFASPNDSYDGPRLGDDDNVSAIDAQWIEQLHEHQRSGKTLHIRYVLIIMLEALKLFKNMKNVEFFELDEDDHKDNTAARNTVTICGDIHGQYYDYLHIFALNGMPSTRNAYLFNGDFVDRGSWSCEVILSMLALKLLYPRHFMMTRGNHETINMNNMYGFKGEVEHKYSAKVFDLFTEIFNALPLAYVLGKKVFVCHGGLMKKEGVSIDEIQTINRFQQPEEGVMTDILWSDPQDQRGLAPSKRGGGTMFGPDITEKFLKRNNLELIVRSHEVQEDGYKVLHNGKLITIFSAPNYVDQMGNKAAFITMCHDYKPKFTQFEAQKHPNIKPMAYGGGGMGQFFM
eukprot:CAMPEP_0202694504 /NCGR_PEP_ID=MMETSP1385-20130828/8351_1 /ASSEMBLY_ACC=CAM_ASM_000861 /TAXON_ID=933848 /ORGANISM="Elphidium margaritaceum" /LENGTH=529 /DNA_ID=CAMNT_0049350367 /DNA_START=35 /DNA_END=1624 /DNA_ORIENTATION=-